MHHYQYVVHEITIPNAVGNIQLHFTLPTTCMLSRLRSCYDVRLITLFAGVESNFEKVSSAFATTQSVPYDYRSIMHYSAYAFSQNGNPTIEPINSSVSLRDLGQRSGFSDSDLQHVNVLYCGESELYYIVLMLNCNTWIFESMKLCTKCMGLCLYGKSVTPRECN